MGIGTSAGVQAFQTFFDHMPADSGMVFIAVPDLDPIERSHMVEVLERRAAMRVVIAEDGQRIDTVYVIPPDRYLTVGEGSSAWHNHKKRTAIGAPRYVFHSLDREMRGRAVAIVLSGTGTNGVSGLRTGLAEGDSFKQRLAGPGFQSCPGPRVLGGDR